VADVFQDIGRRGGGLWSVGHASSVTCAHTVHKPMRWANGTACDAPGDSGVYELLADISGLDAVGARSVGAVGRSLAVECDDVAVDHVVIGRAELLDPLLELTDRVAGD